MDKKYEQLICIANGWKLYQKSKSHPSKYNKLLTLEQKLNEAQNKNNINLKIISDYRKQLNLVSKILQDSIHKVYLNNYSNLSFDQKNELVNYLIDLCSANISKINVVITGTLPIFYDLGIRMKT